MSRSVATDRAAVLAALDALAMTECPYYRGDGICESGCRDEPRCQTEQPTEGWVAHAVDLLTEAES